MRSRIVALSVVLVVGAGLAVPATASVSYAEAAVGVGELPIDACKISSAGVGTFNEGFERDLRAAAPTGELVVQVIRVEFPDLGLGAPGNLSAAQVEEGISTGTEHLEILSDGRLEVTVIDDAEPVTMPKPSTDYPAGEQSNWSADTWMAFVVDAVLAAPTSIDFAASDVVWLFFPWAAPLPTRAEADNIIYVPEGGPPVERAVTVPMVEGSLETTLVHETGHTFGLPDLYDPSGELPQAQYVSDFDLMGWAPGGEFFSWHRWRLDWIDDAQVRCIAPAGAGGLDVTLHALTRNQDTVAAVIPTSDHRVLVLESRRPDRYNEGWLSGGLLIYVVSSDVETGAGPVRIAPKDGMEPPQFAADFESAPLAAGERYTDAASGTTITVIESTEWTDTVRIAPMTVPTPTPTPPPAPGPGAVPANGNSSTLPPTGLDAAGIVAVSAGLLGIGAFSFVVAMTLRRRHSR